MEAVWMAIEIAENFNEILGVALLVEVVERK